MITAVQIYEVEADVEYLTAGQVATLLGVDRSTIHRWRKEGYLGDIKQKGFGPTSPFVYPRDKVEEIAARFGIELNWNGVEEE